MSQIDAEYTVRNSSEPSPRRGFIQENTKRVSEVTKKLTPYAVSFIWNDILKVF